MSAVVCALEHLTPSPEHRFGAHVRFKCLSRFLYGSPFPQPQGHESLDVGGRWSPNGLLGELS